MVSNIVNKSGPKATEEQEAIDEACARRDGSVMIEAGAGCGKSSTLAMVAPRLRQPTLALAFNKSIAVDMATRFPSNFSCKTMNGLGHGAWQRRMPSGRKLQLESNKLSKLTTQYLKENKLSNEVGKEGWVTLRDLVEKAMQQGLVPDGVAGQGLLPDSEASWQAIADDLLLLPDEVAQFVPLAREVLLQHCKLALDGIISFDDQVYCPTMLGGQFTPYPILVVDENQDLSPLNHVMLAKCLRKDGRVVSCGDRRQAIYAFRGASGASAEAIRGLRPANTWIDLPLMTTFRCPKAVAQRQEEHVPGYRAHEGNPQGHLGVLAREDEKTRESVWDWKGLEEEITQTHEALGRSAAPSVAILCRNNGPLIKMAFKLIRQGVGVVMTGRDIGKGLVMLSRKLASDDTMPIAQVIAKITEWKEKEVEIARSAGKEEKLDAIYDKAESLMAVAGEAGTADAGGLRLALERIFSRDNGLVTLSSIHKAKGLEWDTVLHLDPWRVPSKRIREAASEVNAPLSALLALEQEKNLKYVCETRTRHTLLWANIQDFR